MIINLSWPFTFNEKKLFDHALKTTLELLITIKE